MRADGWLVDLVTIDRTGCRLVEPFDVVDERHVLGDETSASDDVVRRMTLQRAGVLEASTKAVLDCLSDHPH
jgi:hypothetical protein